MSAPTACTLDRADRLAGVRSAAPTGCSSGRMGRLESAREARRAPDSDDAHDRLAPRRGRPGGGRAARRRRARVLPVPRASSSRSATIPSRLSRRSRRVCPRRPGSGDLVSGSAAGAASSPRKGPSPPHLRASNTSFFPPGHADDGPLGKGARREHTAEPRAAPQAGEGADPHQKGGGPGRRSWPTPSSSWPGSTALRAGRVSRSTSSGSAPSSRSTPTSTTTRAAPMGSPP